MQIRSLRGGVTEARRHSSSRLIGACLALVASATGQDEAFPYLHLTRTAGTPQLRSNFGYTAAAGKLGSLSDTRDDVVACAINEDDGSMPNVGAGYIFLDANLNPPTDPNQRRLLPLTPETGQQLGRLAVVIGNPRGSGYTNLILLSGFGTTAEYCSPAEPVLQGGSVEIYDFNDQEFEGLPLLSLVAPLHSGTGDCVDLVPHEVTHFGYAIALADVTRDGVDDVIVGAPETVVESEDQIGRLYILAGHDDFIDTPYDAWIGLNAPESSSPQTNSGTGFGCSIVAANVSESGSSRKDIIVGRHDHNDHASGGQPEGGTAYVIRNQYLHDLFGGDTLNTVSDPVYTDELDEETPEYQVLVNPFSTFQTFGSERYAKWHDWFGWFVFSVGDIGSPNGGGADSIDDVIVHAESTDFVGSSPDPDDPEMSGGGADFVYFGTGETDGAELVHPEHVLLMAPANAGGPQSEARFGRATARIDWYNELTDAVEPALLVAEMDRPVGSVIHAGKVYLIRLPLPAQPEDPWVPVDVDNAWGNTALTEPGGAGAWHLFGSWILALDYWGNQTEQPGQQIVITARGASITTLVEAGKFYTYTPNQP